jgi:ribonucleoside-diphosphate reductase alpha chain
VDANQVNPSEHVDMQAAFQRYCDNAVSKTVNLPAEATSEDVRQIFLLAYARGLKSITVYRDGCREGVLHRKTSKPTVSIYTEAPGLAEPGLPVMAQDSQAVFATVQPTEDLNFIKRPDFLPGGTWKLKTGNGTIYTTVSYDPEEERITEVFVRENSGNEAWELVGRLLSLLLRSRVEPDRILKQLYRTRGQSTIVLNGQIFSSIAQALASTLESAEKHFASPTLPFPKEEPGEESLTDGLEDEGKVRKAQATSCPMCARYTLVPSGGCKTCLNCGYSTCGGTSK